MQVKVWIAYTNNAEVAVSTEDEGEAATLLYDNYSISGSVRVVEMTLELPEIKTIAVSASIPETDGPVTVTIS